MKKISFGILLVILVLVQSGCHVLINSQKAKAAGNTYYMRADGTAPNKAAATGPASDPSKCMSLATHVTQTFSPDDVIYISNQGGNFSGTLTTPSSGTAGHPIIYQNVPAESPVINGTGFTRAVYTGTKNYITFDGLTVINGSSQGMYSLNATGITVKNISISGPGFGIDFSNITAALISNISGSSALFTIRVQNCPTVTIEDVNVSNSSGTAINITGPTAAIVNRITTNHMQNAGVYMSGANNMSVTGDSWTLSNSGEAHSGLVDAISFNANAATNISLSLTNLVIDTAYRSGVYINNGTFAAGSKIDGFDISGFGQHGIDLNNLSNIQLLDGRSHNSTGDFSDGVRLTTASNITLRNSEIYNNGEDGVSAATNSIDFIVEHNKIYNNGTVDQASNGDGFTAHDGCTGQLVTNNLIYGNRNDGFALVGGSSGTAHSNTVVNNGDSTSVNMGVRGGFFSSSTGSWTFKNNILMGNYPLEINITDAAYAASDFDYNLYYHVGNNTVEANAFYINSSFPTSDWANYHINHEPNSEYGNPYFENLGGLDFHLLSNSSAIDAGIDLNVNTDYDGKQRYDDPDVANTGSAGAFSKSYVDIGAYEYFTPPDPALSSLTHPSQSAYYNNNTPQITVSPTSSTTSYYYLVNQTAAPAKSAVEAGTLDSDGFFTVAGTITIDGIWYIHVIAKNLDSDSSNNYSSYRINYDSTAPSTPGTPSTTSPTNNNKPTWSWTASADSGSGLSDPAYTVQWSQDAAFSSGIDSSTSNTNSFTHSSALDDGTWYFRALATDLASNSSSYSENGSVIVDTSVAPILAPTRSWRRWLPWIAGTPFPSASFTTIPADLADIEIGQTISFDASLSGSNIVKYEWDFGDGTTSSGMKVEHKYEKPGRYTVTLTTTDRSGNKSTITKTIDIRPPAPTISDIKAEGESIIFEGKSFPETTVYLTIHSNLYSGQAVADKNGKFSYVVENGSETLGEGDHTVFASAAVILSDNTQLKGKDSKTYDFKVSVDNGKLKVEMKKTKIWQIVSLVLGGIIIIGLAVLVLRGKRRKK